MAEKRCKAERVIIEIGELMQKFDFIKNAKETMAFLKLMKAHLEEMKKAANVNEAFAQMAADRAAARYYGVDKKEFEAQIQKLIAEERAKFERAGKMSDEAFSRIKAMNDSAAKKREERREAERKKVELIKSKLDDKEVDLDELLKDI